MKIPYPIPNSLEPELEKDHEGQTTQLFKKLLKGVAEHSEKRMKRAKKNAYRASLADQDQLKSSESIRTDTDVGI